MVDNGKLTICSSQNGVTLARFEHLGPRLIIERDGSGTILRRYVHGPRDATGE